MSIPVSPSLWWRRSIIVRLPTDYFVRGLLLPFAAVFVFGTAQLTLALGPRTMYTATIALYAGWCGVPLLIALHKRCALQYLIRTEKGEPLCTWCGYHRDPALADDLCPECGKLPEPLADTRRRVYAIARWVPSLTAADSRSLEIELRRFVRSERIVFWPRLVLVTIGFVILTLSLIVTIEIIQDQVPRANLRPIALTLAVIMPLLFVGSILLMRMRRLLRWMRAWTPSDKGSTSHTL
jgi:hypothetical protein